MKGLEPAGETLRQAIAEGSARAAVAAAETESARIERERKELDAERAKAAAALHEQALENERARAEAERVALAERGRNDIGLVNENAERQVLLTQANDPAIQARFAPFLTPAHFVLGCNFYFLPCRYERKQPESYGALQRMEVFENLKQLGYFASRNDARTDRPKWKKPSNEEEWAQLEADQKLFGSHRKCESGRCEWSCSIRTNTTDIGKPSLTLDRTRSKAVSRNGPRLLSATGSG